MILHIIRKDWKLLWPLVVGVALINWIERIAASSRGLFPGRTPFGMVSILLGGVSLLATGILIVLAVQQDAIPGLRQDWLVRPIKRSNLLLSKLLFVVLLVQGPIFVAEVLQGLAAGFPLLQALGAPLSRSLSMFLGFDLGLMAFAALTSNLIEAVGTAVAVVVAGSLFMNADYSLNPNILVNITPVAWVTDALRSAWGLLAAAVILALMYFRRRTIPARWTFAGASVVWLIAALLPWKTAFAIQERFSPQPSLADSVHVAFAADGNIRLEKENLQPTGVQRGPTQNVFVPVEITGVGQGDLLDADWVSARLIGPGGRAIEIGAIPSVRDFRGGPFHQPIPVPEDTWNRLKDQSIRLELDYSLTLMKPDSDRTMPASGGNQWVTDTARCATRINSDRTQIELGCLSPGDARCVTTFIRGARAGMITAQNLDCRTEYAPYFGRLDGDSLSRFHADFSVQGVSTTDLKDAQMVLRVYRPQVHFTRQVVIPDIRLSDWKAK